MRLLVFHNVTASCRLLKRLLRDDLGDFFAGFLALRARPQGIDMAHLLGHMQAGIHTSCLHLVVCLYDIGIKHFPSACKKVGGGQTVHITIKGRNHRVVRVNLPCPVGTDFPQHLGIEEGILFL